MDHGIIILLILAVSTNAHYELVIRESWACEGQTIQLKCDDLIHSATILIKEANFGRTDKTHCVPNGADTTNYDTNCVGANILHPDKMSEACDTKVACQVLATGLAFPVLCAPASTPRYLYVKYECVEEKHHHSCADLPSNCDTCTLYTPCSKTCGIGLMLAVYICSGEWRFPPYVCWAECCVERCPGPGSGSGRLCSDFFPNIDLPGIPHVVQ